jgi:hypothetical protein
LSCKDGLRESWGVGKELHLCDRPLKRQSLQWMARRHLGQHPHICVCMHVRKMLCINCKQGDAKRSKVHSERQTIRCKHVKWSEMKCASAACDRMQCLRAVLADKDTGSCSFYSALFRRSWTQPKKTCTRMPKGIKLFMSDANMRTSTP